MQTKIKIVSIVPVGPIFKGATLRGMGFITRTELTLEDGRKIPSHESATRKKDIATDLVRSQKLANEGKFFANFNEDGTFWGTSREYGCLSGLIS